MKNFSVTSKPVTENIITVEMTEKVANAIANAITRDLNNYGRGLTAEYIYPLEQLRDAIKGHISNEVVK
jgi:hypothetical protein